MRPWPTGPLLAEATRPRRHPVGDRWFVDETYVKISGISRYVYRAVGQHGQVIDALVLETRDHRRSQEVLHLRRPSTTDGEPLDDWLQGVLWWIARLARLSTT